MDTSGKNIALMACRDARDYVAATRHLSPRDKAILFDAIEARIAELNFINTLHHTEGESHVYRCHIGLCGQVYTSIPGGIDDA